MKEIVRIANASGYWGDDPEALLRQVAGGSIDYVTLDYLAEITMVILQRQRARDPRRGFAYDFVEHLRPALTAIARNGVTVIANAGGINPAACADAVAELCRECGVDLPIGVVSGDDLQPRIDELTAADGAAFAHLDAGGDFTAIRDRVVAANAYLGARAIVAALERGARIIVTGRTADAALTLAPLVFEFGWAWDDWNRIAAGTVAGHVLECGAQATGGNYTDWQRIPSMLDVGYPIVEGTADGTFVVTKHPDTGGLVNRRTVTEQILYEIGDPRAYLTPDVAVDFTSLELSEDGPDRVRVCGARGRPAPADLKVSVVYRHGYRAAATLLISGPHTIAKAQRFAEMVWHRVGREFEDMRTDFIGYRACWGDAAQDIEPNEVVLRLAVADADRGKLERFSRNVLGFALQGPPGIGIFGGRPEVQEAYGFWPGTVARNHVGALVEVRAGERKQQIEVPSVIPVTGVHLPDGDDKQLPIGPLGESRVSRTSRVRLSTIAYARSGDKGDHSNIGVGARSAPAFEFLREALSAKRVRTYYQELVVGDVERYELPNLLAFNFVLHNSLGGGGTLSLRVDHQGKTLGQGLLAMEIDVPDDVLASVGA